MRTCLLSTMPPLAGVHPNPNVLVELGYALGKLGEGKVVCVHNLVTGRVEDLPFDIRGRTVATYELPPKAGVPDEATWQALRAEQRKQLVGRLKHALTAVLSATDPAVANFVNQMVEKLILVIVFGGEVEDRPIKPGSEVLRSIFGGVAGELTGDGLSGVSRTPESQPEARRSCKRHRRSHSLHQILGPGEPRSVRRAGHESGRVGDGSEEGIRR